jgi:hypothetical protein
MAISRRASSALSIKVSIISESSSYIFAKSFSSD